MDVLQTALVFMVLIVCVFLILFGVMLFFILREIKEALDRLNKLLETSEEVASEIGKPVAAAAGLVSTIGAGVKAAQIAAKIIGNLFSNSKKTKENVQKLKEVRK